MDNVAMILKDNEYRSIIIGGEKAAVDRHLVLADGSGSILGRHHGIEVSTVDNEMLL